MDQQDSNTFCHSQQSAPIHADAPIWKIDLLVLPERTKKGYLTSDQISFSRPLLHIIFEKLS